MKRTEQINLVFLLTVLTYLLLSFVLGILPFDLPFYATILLSQFGLALMPLIYVFRYEKNLKDAVSLNRISVANVILTITLTLCIEPFLSLLNGLSQCFVSTPAASQITGAAGQLSFPVMFLLVAVMPAVLEEFVYRGVFFHSYKEEAVVPGAVLSGLLFGIMHGNLNQFAYAFFMGVIFALVVYATGSLAASMIMHLTVNGLSVCLLYLQPKVMAIFETTVVAEAEMEETFVLTVPIVLRTYGVPAVVGLVLGFFVFRTVARNAGRWENVCEAFRRKGKLRSFAQLFTWPLFITVILMVFLMTYMEFQ